MSTPILLAVYLLASGSTARWCGNHYNPAKTKRHKSSTGLPCRKCSEPTPQSTWTGARTTDPGSAILPSTTKLDSCLQLPCISILAFSDQNLQESLLLVASGTVERFRNKELPKKKKPGIVQRSPSSTWTLLCSSFLVVYCCNP